MLLYINEDTNVSAVRTLFRICHEISRGTQSVPIAGPRYTWINIVSSMPGDDMTPGVTWWRYQMETFSALLAICAENSPVSGEFPAPRPVTRSFHVFFDLRLWGWWLETPSRSIWRHNNKDGIIKLKSVGRQTVVVFVGDIKEHTSMNHAIWKIG